MMLAAEQLDQGAGVVPEHLERAFDRIDDFVAVRAGRAARGRSDASGGARPPARWTIARQEGVRSGPLVRRVLCRRVEFAPVGEVAHGGACHVALGIVVGRRAGEFAREACPPRH
jgi:hypothetical protein